MGKVKDGYVQNYEAMDVIEETLSCNAVWKTDDTIPAGVDQALPAHVDRLSLRLTRNARQCLPGIDLEAGIYHREQRSHKETNGHNMP